jgi:predicted PurR-regulated permease PerM
MMKANLYKSFLILILVIFSFPVKATNTPPKINPTGQQEQRIAEIKTRMDEIKALDKSQLTKEERKELRKELKAIKNEAQRLSGGVYFAAGAILVLVIVLLLVL